jgi:hypothetical protein
LPEAHSFLAVRAIAYDVLIKFEFKKFQDSKIIVVRGKIREKFV